MDVFPYEMPNIVRNSMEFKSVGITLRLDSFHVFLHKSIRSAECQLWEQLSQSPSAQLMEKIAMSK